MLHIYNGDSTADIAKNAGIPGEHAVWREALVCGPAPGHLSEPEFIKVRANHLAEAYVVPIEKCESDLQTQHESLASFSDHEEVALWFEHDLFCQINLIYLLNWFAQEELGETKLSLICIDEFPSVQIFHGLGQLNEEQLTSLLPRREPITTAQLEVGALAWQAYSSPNPAKLISLLTSDLSVLPFLDAALRRHLLRFPSTRNGLGRIENIGLELVAGGYPKFKSLFPAFMRREPEYGFGDAQFYLALRRMATSPVPLLTQKNGGNSAYDPARMLLSSFELTEQGEAVMAGAEDFVIQNGIDLWLGGVHLKGKESPWRWDEIGQELLVSL
ncbi:MAG: DUF1835 domain-containing protein [Pyrinomonadaceae bacterium]